MTLKLFIIFIILLYKNYLNHFFYIKKNKKIFIEKKINNNFHF